MRGVPLFSPEGRALIERGPAWHEHPAYYREEPPWCDQCHGHRTECAFCGYEGDGLCDDAVYPADAVAFTRTGPQEDR
jgi:hypothetical protein